MADLKEISCHQENFSGIRHPKGSLQLYELVPVPIGIFTNAWKVNMKIIADTICGQYRDKQGENKAKEREVI